MAVKLFLNSQSIINHVFPVNSKNSYDATEVDKFLDVIIQDYSLVETSTLIQAKQFDTMKENIKILEKDKRNLEVE